MFYTLYLGVEVAVALCVCSKCAYISKPSNTFHSRVFYMYIARTCLTSFISSWWWQWTWSVLAWFLFHNSMSLGSSQIVSVFLLIIFYLSVLWEVPICFHVLRIRNPLRLRNHNTNPERTLLLLPPPIEVEAVQVESPNSQGLLHEKVIWMVTRSNFIHVLKFLSNLPSTV